MMPNINPAFREAGARDCTVDGHVAVASAPGRHLDLPDVAAFKPAYLIHGDDHGRIAERRAALRALAERESGSNGVECFEGDTSAPDVVAGALAAMTFAIGRRFLIVDGAERWKDADIQTHLLPALASIAEETTIAFFAREEGRFKVSPQLAKAVEQAGGSVAAERTMKAKELPKWLQGEAARLGVVLDRDGAQALVAHVGERQQRLLRELEKLALELGEGARIGADDVDEVAAHSAEHQVWGLVDTLVAGDAPAATRAYLELAAQGESVSRLVGLLARRVRDVLAIAQRLEAGENPAQIKAAIKGNPWALDRRIAEARRSDADRLARALEALSDLELATHGASELSDPTAMISAIAKIAA
jgi:DNA polymerase-3 subunit delta